MSITIHTEPLAYTEFRDFIISSANWFVPSLLQMPNLDEWILKMYHNGSIYYTISDVYKRQVYHLRKESRPSE